MLQVSSSQVIDLFFYIASLSISPAPRAFLHLLSSLSFFLSQSLFLPLNLVGVKLLAFSSFCGSVFLTAIRMKVSLFFSLRDEKPLRSEGTTWVSLLSVFSACPFLITVFTFLIALEKLPLLFLKAVFSFRYSFLCYLYIDKEMYAFGLFITYAIINNIDIL